MKRKSFFSRIKISIICILFLTSLIGSITTNVQAAQPNLVLYLPFDEGSGSTANDESGNGNEGVINGVPTWVTGVSGWALQLDGNNDNVIVNNTDILESVNALTIACWVKISYSTSFGYFIMASGFGLWQVGNETGLAIHLPLTDSAKGLTLIDEWKQITGTYDGTDIKYYVDGVLVDTFNHPGTMDVDSRLFIVGFFSTTYWAGFIDEICVWNKTLTDEEVENHFNNTNCAPVPLSPIFIPLLTVIGILIVFRKRK